MYIEVTVTICSIYNKQISILCQSRKNLKDLNEAQILLSNLNEIF